MSDPRTTYMYFYILLILKIISVDGKAKQVIDDCVKKNKDTIFYFKNKSFL